MGAWDYIASKLKEREDAEKSNKAMTSDSKDEKEAEMEAAKKRMAERAKKKKPLIPEME